MTGVQTGAHPILSYTLNAKYNGRDRVYTGTMVLSKATWHRITFRVDEYGEVQVNITIDDTVTDEEQEVPINPYA